MSPAIPVPTFPEEACRVLAFWFEQPLHAPGLALAERQALQQNRQAWFLKSDAFDESCRSQFGALCEQALAGGLDSWNANTQSALARIVLLDQVPRNIFRGTPRAFAGDAAARAATEALLAHGALDHYTRYEQVFALLPLEHAEDSKAQEESVRLFEGLAAREPELASNADYARRHGDVVLRFGRFPHRNAILGRPSTAEEAEFLKGPNSSF